MIDIGRVISTVIQFIDGFTRPSKAVIENMQQMGSNIIKTSKQIQNAGKTISNVGSGLAKSITVPIAGIATAAIKTAADFEASMSQVAATMGKSKEEITDLTALAQKMGATTAFSASEAANGVNILAMTGLKAVEINDTLGTVLDTAAAGAIDLSSAASYIVGAVKGFGDETKNASKYADLMAKGATLANTDVAALGEALSYGAATAAGYSQTADSVTLALLRMAEQNVTGQTAATSLNRAMADLYSPTAEAQKAIKNLGIAVYNTDGSARDFNVIVDEMAVVLSEMTEQQANSVKSTIFTTNGLNAFNKMTSSSTQKVKELKQGLAEASGSAAQQAATQLDNLNGQLTILKSGIEGAAIAFGNKMLPSIKKVVTFVQVLMDKINGLSDAQVNNIIKWAGIAAAIGPVIMTFGKVVTTIGKVQNVYGTMIKKIGDFGGVAKLVTSPAGRVIIALVAIAAAAVLIIKNWSKVSSFLSNIKTWFDNTFGSIGISVDSFKNKFLSVKDTLESIANKIGNIFKKIGNIFKKEFSGEVKEGAAGIKSGFKTIAAGTVVAFDSITTAIDKGLKVFDALLNFFTGAFCGNWDSAASAFKESLKNMFPPNVANGLITAFDKTLPIITAVVGVIQATFDGLIKDAKKIFDNFKSIFGGVGTLLKGIFSGDTKTALKGFKTAVDGIIDLVGNIFKTKLNAIKNFVVKILSSFLPEGAVSKIAGIFDTIAATWDVAISAAKGAVFGLIRAVKPLFNDIKTIFSGVSQFVKGIVSGDWSGAWNGLKKIASGAVSGLVHLIKSPFTVIKNLVKSAIKTLKGFSGVKKVFSALGNAIKKVLSKCGIDFETFSTSINNIKTKIGNILLKLKTAFGTVFHAISNGCIQGFIKGLRPVLDSIRTIFHGISQFISGIFSGDWKKALSGLKTAAQGIFSGLIHIIKAPFIAIGKAIKSGINAFKNLKIVKNIVNGVGNTIKKVLSKCGVNFKKLSANINNIKTRIGNILNNLKTIIGSIFSKIGKVVGKLKTGFSTAFSGIGGKATGFGAKIKAVFHGISAVIKMVMSIIVPVIKVAFSAISGSISAAVNFISSLLSGLFTIFDGITTFISGVFTGNWSKAWEGVKTIFSGVFESFSALCKAPINAVIGIINGAINGINKLGLTIPDWVPLIGGKDFSINIPTIPMLYKGTKNWQGGAAIIHDRGGEIVDLPKGSRVYPHDKSIEMARKEGTAKNGTISINIQKLADKIEVCNDKDIDRIAEAIVIKLKKVAFNTGGI